MESNNKIKDIDTCNGDDLTIQLSRSLEDNEASIILVYNDPYYEEASEKHKEKHTHALILTPELAIRFSNLLREYAFEAFAHNVTLEQFKSQELKRICPF